MVGRRETVTVAANNPGPSPAPPSGDGAASQPSEVADGGGLPEDLESGPAAAAPGPVAADASAGGGDVQPAAPAGPPVFQDLRRREVSARRAALRMAPVTDPSLAAAQASHAPGLPHSPDEGSSEQDDGVSREPGPPPVPATPAPAPVAPAAAGRAPVPAARVSPPAPAPVSPVAPPFTRVKVQGMAYDVPTAEVEAAGGVVAYQIGKATEISLRSVQNLERQYQSRLAATPPASTPTAAAPGPGGKPAPAPSAAVDYKDVARKLHDAVLESNVDGMASVLEGLGQRAAPPPAPAPPAAPAPAQRLQTNRTNQEIAHANAIFDAEFGHLHANPLAMDAARRQIVERMTNSAFDAFPLDMLVRDIGTRTAAHVGAAPASAPGPSVDEQLELRRRAKARLPAASQAGATVPAAPTAPPPSKEAKNSAYVARLRQRSGSNSALAERGVRR